MDSSDVEKRGRFLLWRSATNECCSLLKLACKINRSVKTQSYETPLRKGQPTFEEFRKGKSNYVAGMLHASHMLEYEELYHSNFPTLVECYLIKDYCMMLMSVFFCQMLNIGYGHNGIASKNTKEFVNTHFNEIVKTSFSNEADRAEFIKLKDTLLAARDTMIGHADAKSFDIQHGAGLTSLKMPIISVKDIDPEVAYKLMKGFEKGLSEYSEEVLRMFEASKA